MNKIKTIGVIVITYNGERYISQQLESIRKQTIKPDRVLIFDDCSLDRTAAIVSDFILKYDLCNWELFQNSQNVGWGENGFRALLRCDTDIIFWSDQDDVWRRDKIETFVLQMEKQVYLAMYSGWSYIDSDGYRINHFAGKGTGRGCKEFCVYGNLSFPDKSSICKILLSIFLIFCCRWFFLFIV